jgi:AcrR family transcriptional regulator
VRIAKPTKAKGTERRNKIIRAFMGCVRRHGYIKTTMAEIAAEADIQPGHLAYYFGTKEEILGCCYLAQAEIIVQGLEESRHYHGEEKIDYLASFFFTDNPKVNCFTTALMFETFGAALNDADLKRCRQLMDDSARKLFVSVFEDLLGRHHPSLQEKADVAYAYLPGLKFVLYFDDDRGLETGRRMFRDMLRALSGFPTL